MPGRPSSPTVRSLTTNRTRLSPKAPLSKTITLGSSDTAKILLTAKDNGKGKRPHQVFLLLKETETGLEAPFVLEAKDTGKATVKIVRTALRLPYICSPCR